VTIEYEIRDATPSDDRAIAAFQTGCWREAYRGLVPDAYLDAVGEGDRERRWRERLESGARRVAIAWAGDQVAGVVSWGSGERGMPALELKSLYVGAEHRGSGVAAVLAERAIGTSPAHLWVFADNPRAQAFYAKLGFRPDGSRQIDPDTGVPEVRLVRGAAAGTKTWSPASP
jgi:GNAT superfamily N-acetyltransferase